MTSASTEINVRQLVADSLLNVFDTMLSMKITPNPDSVAPGYAEHVSGSVGFAGELVNGAVYIHISSEFAKVITAGMLGMTVEEVTGDAEVNDVVGEVCNMLAGGLKSSLCDAGYPCAVSTPGIIRGASFQIETVPDVKLERLLYDCQEHRIMVEVHVKFLN